MARKKALSRDSHSHVIKLVSELSEAIPLPAGVTLRDEAEMVIWEQFTRARTREGWREFDLLTLSKAVYRRPTFANIELLWISLAPSSRTTKAPRSSTHSFP